jgi:polyribonucleotide nucleotidyltransferase
MQKVSMHIAGKELILETGRIAKQANGAVFARYEGSAVIATGNAKVAWHHRQAADCTD